LSSAAAWPLDIENAPTLVITHPSNIAKWLPDKGFPVEEGMGIRVIGWVGVI
jgi:hypothetical protein